MDEKRINERRNWKAETFSYDYYLPDESRECSYCLTDKQAEILRGAIEPMGWATRWWSDSDVDIDPDTVEAFRDDLIRRLMMSCCDDAIYKYIGTVLYKSTDGGETWEVAPPEDDYRTSSTYWPKPSELGIDQTKCQAADSVVATFRDQMINTVNDDMAVLAIVGVFVTILLTFLTAGSYALIAAQVAALAAGIFAAGVATWKAEFDSEVWNDFRCLIFENMSDDESIDAAGLESVYASVDDIFSGIVAQTLKGYLSAAGLVGINNMMASNIGDSDAECDCDEHIPVYVQCEGGAGNTISNDGTTLVAEAVPNSGGYLLYLCFEPEMCGGVVAGGKATVTPVTGSPIFAAYTPFGGSGEISPGLTPPQDLCAIHLAFTSLSPFTVSATAVPC